MAIGTITTPRDPGAVAFKPVQAIWLSFAGDDAYPTGGTAGIQSSLRTTLGRNATIAGVSMQLCGGYVPQYDQANDKLLVYEAGADGAPLDEVTATTDLSSTTFNITVFYY